MNDHFDKIARKSNKLPGDYGDLDITNRLGFNKKTQESINKDKIEKGFSKFEDRMNKETFKAQPRMKTS